VGRCPGDTRQGRAAAVAGGALFIPLHTAVSGTKITNKFHYFFKLRKPWIDNLITYAK